MKFVPDNSYEGLKRQAFAMSNLVDSLEKQLSHYRSKDYELSERRLAKLEENLESEREMNAKLTEEIEALLERT